MGKQASFKNWITDGSGHCFYTRKSFFLKKKTRRAVVYVTGLGQFNFYVNGTKIGDHVLDPAWTDYRKIVYYLTFDVTEVLREGESSFAMTQAAEAMPLFWKMVSENKEKDVADSFRMLLEQDGCLRTGEVGEPYIIQSMNRYGMNGSAGICRSGH